MPKKGDTNYFGVVLGSFLDFLKNRKISNLQRRKALQNAQNGFQTGEGAKISRKESTAPTKVHERKYNSLNEFWGQNDPPWASKG